MLLTRDLYPEQPKTVDKIVQASDLSYLLTAKQLSNGAPAVRSLAANTGFVAIVYEADAATTKNAVFSFTDLTTPGSIVPTTPPGTNGQLAVTVPGNWTYALKPGSYTVVLLLKTAADTVLLGRLFWLIADQSGA